MTLRRPRLGLLALLLALGACGEDAPAASTAATSSGGGAGGAGGEASTGVGGGGSTGVGGAPSAGVVHVVLFTHIEDASPPGMLASPTAKQAYLGLRQPLLAMAEAAAARDITWVLQPDWKYLEAARLYEEPTVTVDTGGVNLFVHLRDALGVAIDPHSHEKSGYNYTDVAHLLTLLGVGGSTVIGGHIWDPSLPEFQDWDRFRAPVPGQHYPEATPWRGDILIGAGTPNHVNDPLVSGLWRPQDRDHFFVDDPAANIVAAGAWANAVAGVGELVALHEAGTISGAQLLTASWNVTPNELLAEDGIATIDATILEPLAALQAAGKVRTTDFTTLVATWKSDYGAVASLYAP